MAFELQSKKIPKPYKVKIRDRERLEQPHVSILKKTECWRLGLRSLKFLDDVSWSAFPDGIREAIDENLEQLIREWNRMYPENPV